MVGAAQMDWTLFMLVGWLRIEIHPALTDCYLSIRALHFGSVQKAPLTREKPPALPLAGLSYAVLGAITHREGIYKGPSEEVRHWLCHCIGHIV